MCGEITPPPPPPTPACPSDAVVHPSNTPGVLRVVCCVCFTVLLIVFADSSPSHSSVPPHSLSPAFAEDDDEFSDFIQGPVEASFPSSSLPLPFSSSGVRRSPLEAGPGQRPSSGPLSFSLAPSVPTLTVPHHSSVISSSQSTFQGNFCLIFYFDFLIAHSPMCLKCDCCFGYDPWAVPIEATLGCDLNSLVSYRGLLECWAGGKPWHRRLTGRSCSHQVAWRLQT